MDPEKVLVAGDWHGNRRWAVDSIWKARKLDEPRIICQLGDFGFWSYKHKEWAPGERHPEALRYLEDVQSALELIAGEIWVTPGNHDNYDDIDKWVLDQAEDRIPVPGFGRIIVLRRGARWQWHDREWLSAGGAVSVDRLLPRPGRVPHESWWPQEEITREEELAIIADGYADVMLAHDYPARVHHEFDHHKDPFFHPDDLERAQLHTERMQRIVDGVMPKWYMHGHLHRNYGRVYDWGWGPVQVSGLGMDGDPGNLAVLDVRSMEWSPAPA
jgi:Calcineurin-like phosphoesterase